VPNAGRYRLAAQPALLPVALLLGACAAAAPPELAGDGPRRHVISPPGATRIAPYASAVRTGNLIFFSGVIGTLPGSRELAPGGVQPELRQAFENLRGIMDAAGVGTGDMVKCTVFLADIREFDAMNEVYAAFFGADPPARTTLGAAGLPLNARVEVDCIAAAPR
jgi:2-iminobutanoate/2-iminopropanoate deaminase